ncbi:MAG: glycosyltransferase, partial [Actinomycetota bacterium]|nr:glycosyltransferase [Actinomycetota bacterium]
VTPGRPSALPLYALLVAAEAYNMMQGAGFWWTVWNLRPQPVRRPVTEALTVDVFIPVCGEPLDVVEPTVAAAVKLRTADARICVLDDGDDPAIEAMARRHGVHYLHRPEREGAKAGNINWALERTEAPYVAVLDCDHVPDQRFLEITLAYFDEPAVAFVQTPQYYANAGRGGVAAASWAQQALFFGSIAVARDAMGAMFCCGTNVVFRREALESTGNFPTHSLTEDFELSIDLHERGWTSRYVPEVLAAGLAPEDMGSYAGQQLRWARGCLSALPRILTARLPGRLRLNYLLSAAYWLTGWTLVAYFVFPVARILTGAQPVEVGSANEFLLHWGPYFLCSMGTVALVARGRYTYAAFALMETSFWIHVVASLLTLLRRKGRFAVTPKQGAGGRQFRPVAVPLLVCAVLVGTALFGLTRDRSPATVTNVSFVMVHVTVLLSGAWPALRGDRRERTPSSAHEPLEPVL